MYVPGLISSLQVRDPRPRPLVTAQQPTSAGVRRAKHSGLGWSLDGRLLAVGLADGTVEVFLATTTRTTSRADAAGQEGPDATAAGGEAAAGAHDAGTQVGSAEEGVGGAVAGEAAGMACIRAWRTHRQLVNKVRWNPGHAFIDIASDHGIGDDGSSSGGKGGKVLLASASDDGDIRVTGSTSNPAICCRP